MDSRDAGNLRKALGYLEEAKSEHANGRRNNAPDRRYDACFHAAIVALTRASA